MLRILFFINTLACGGAERVLVNLLRSLPPDEFEISLVTVLGGEYEKDIPTHVKYKKIIQTDKPFWRNWLSKIVFNLPARLFHRLFLNREMDLKVAYMEGFPTKVLWFDQTCTTIAFVHSDVSVSGSLKQYYETKEACYYQYSCFDKVCFVSEAARKGFESLYGKVDNSLVLHNVIDRKLIKQKSEEACECFLRETSVKLVAVGRLAKEKGYDRLLKAASVLEKRYDFEIVIVGDGSERKRLERLIVENNIKSITLAGFQENPYKYISKADLLVCVSYYEGYSTVVAEALSVGVPVFTTDCAGMRELLGDGRYGIIVDNNDKDIVIGLQNVLEHSRIIWDLKASIAEKSVLSNLGEYRNLFSEINNKQNRM